MLLHSGKAFAPQIVRIVGCIIDDADSLADILARMKDPSYDALAGMNVAYFFAS